MDRPRRSPTLRDYGVFWVLLPLLVVVAAFLLLGVLAFQRILTDLLLDRQRQIATTVASEISALLEGHAHALETWAASPELLHPSPERRLAALETAAQALEEFELGLALLDEEGGLVAHSPQAGSAPDWEAVLQSTFPDRKASRFARYSQLITDPGLGEHLILVSAPLGGGRGEFQGVLVGAARTREAAFADTIRRLRVGRDGFAYLVDKNGKIIFHRDESQIGEDYSGRPFYRQLISDDSSGMLWETTGEERLIEGDAPVATAGWTLIVQESWSSAAAPARSYSLAAAVTAVLVVFFVTFISWQGLRRISVPIQMLSEQTDRLSRGSPINTFTRTGIHELDELERSFDEMARQISTYRAGMHRYIEALNQSQENERRRIARELHDETVQNLLAVSRQLELYQLMETTPHQSERIDELQQIIAETLTGLRRVIRDLRPLILDDLGLVPALQALVRGLREGPQAVPHVQFEVSGDQVELSAEQELALYRIAQEALNNIRRHAAATGVEVRLVFQDGSVALEVEDNGQGFQVPDSLADFSQRGHFGLMGIQERAWALEGEFTIESSPGRGARLCVQAPIHARPLPPVDELVL